MKLVVLGTNSSTTWMMVDALISDYPDLHVVIEKPVSRIMILKKRMLRIGVNIVIGQIFFMLYLVILKRLTVRKIDLLIKVSSLSIDPPKDVSITHFDSVNSQSCIKWLQKMQPSIVILNGTRILSADALQSCNAVFLNIHCGITPAYRGVHGAYWALLRGDTTNVGVTIHAVDAGIDTGSIIFQKSILVDAQDNFLTYPIKQYIEGIPLMRKAISDVVSGKLKLYQRRDLPSAIWSHPTLFQYLWGRFRYGIR